MNTTKIELAKAVLKEIDTIANAVARKEGASVATKIVPGKELKVVKHVQYGYRKYTTDEYVPNSYINNFGWKNCYYQNAETTVSLSPELWAKKEKWEKFLVKN